MIPPVISPQGRKVIRYSITRWDILRWHLYVLRRNRVVIGFLLIATLALAGNDLRSPDMNARSIGFKIFFVLFFAAAMLSTVALITIALMTAMVVFKKFRGLLGEHELEIRDDGLVERTDVNETLHRWAGFHKIAMSGRYLYIYVTDNNVHFVPRRCFGSEQELQGFRDELERRMRAALRPC